MTTQTVLDKLQAFAEKHGLVLETKGEVGFGRPCVGFIKGYAYVDTEVLDLGTFEALEGFPEDDRILAPEGVEAYHKHSCLCVLVREGDEENEDAARDRAVEQLARWVDSLEGVGVEVVAYTRRSVPGVHMLQGNNGWAIRATTPPEPE